MSLLVCLKSTGEIEKKVVASVTESLKADYSFGEDWHVWWRSSRTPACR